MSWRDKYVANTLERKYGVLGKIASRYVLSGHSVRVVEDLGVILATKEGTTYVIGYIISSQVGKAGDVSERIKELASRIKGKPVLILYGKGKFNLEKIEELTGDVMLKRIR